jgi:hypothetical protein
MSETEAKWVERLREWQDSAKTAEEFAAGKPFKASTLKWWRTQLRRREKAGGPTQGRTKAIPMARVIRRAGPRAPTTSAVGGDGMAVEISGARISIGRGCDLEFLAKVVRALGRAQ